MQKVEVPIIVRFDSIETALNRQDLYEKWYRDLGITVVSFIYICENDFKLKILITG